MSGYIDAQTGRVTVEISPSTDGRAGMLEHPGTESADAACPLREGDEHHRGYFQPVRESPSRQGLDPAALAAIDLILRLEVDHQFPTENRFAQQYLHRRTVPRRPRLFGQLPQEQDIEFAFHCLIPGI